MLTLALLKCVEPVGEAAFKVSRNFRDAHPRIPWRALAEMRNSLVHDYYDVDVDAVWNTITNELPPLLAELGRQIGE